MKHLAESTIHWMGGQAITHRLYVGISNYDDNNNVY